MGVRLPYEPKGAALELAACREAEVLFEGPAGVGKSRAWLERMHFLAQKYPGSRHLILRKTRRSLTESALVTFERDVLMPGHPLIGRRSRSGRESYRYPNGSEIVVGGIDNPSKVLSTEYDLIYVQEATELLEEDWETLLTRLRNGRMPYQQLGADCNPSRPTHWLNQRCHSGKTARICGRLEDNPLFWDGSDWTKKGAAYRAVLDRLTGTRRARLRDGRWVASEGVIYDEFDARVHVVEPFEPPHDWRRVWVVDFGFTNPFVWQDWAIDPDGRAFLVREIYQTQGLVRDHALEILRLSLGSPRPEAVVCDHDAEGRATLESELGMRTLAARKGVREGIQRVKDALRPALDGRPRQGGMVVKSDLEMALGALQAKQAAHGKAWNYYEGRHPLVYSSGRLKQVFRRLDARFTCNWCAVAVDAVFERLRLRGLEAPGAEAAMARVWRASGLALEALEVGSLATLAVEEMVEVGPTIGSGGVAVWPLSVTPVGV